MQNLLIKNKLGIMVCMLSLIAVGVFTYAKTQQPHKVVMLKSSFAIDLSDDEALVNNTDNIFIGEVISKKGIKKINDAPETQFGVRVLEVIKGSLEGIVTVNQKGGYIGNTLYLIAGDALLVPGKKYLFATRYYSRENWYTLIPTYGNLPIYRDEQIPHFIDRFQKHIKVK